MADMLYYVIWRRLDGSQLPRIISGPDTLEEAQMAQHMETGPAEQPHDWHQFYSCEIAATGDHVGEIARLHTLTERLRGEVKHLTGLHTEQQAALHTWAGQKLEWVTALDLKEAEIVALKKAAAEAAKSLTAVTKDRDSWKTHHEFYVRAWVRALGGKIFNKAHEIDGLVKTTNWLREKANVPCQDKMVEGDLYAPEVFQLKYVNTATGEVEPRHGVKVLNVGYTGGTAT